MHCPRCGLQQVSEESSFCTRCGFQLSVVKELLSGNGLLPTHSTVAAVAPQPTPTYLSRKGIRAGAKLMFWSVVVAPLFLVLSFIFDNPIPLFFPMIVFLAGLARILYTIIFGEDLWPPRGHEIASGKATTYLHAQTAIAVGELQAKQADTAEMTQPPSVVERTTKLLKND